MGVYIKGMEMPKSCDVCDFVYDLNEGDLGIHNYCGFPGIGVYVDDCIATRHKDCPLGEVVHCKDCKWYTDSAHIDHSKMCKLLGVYPAPDGYCYAGKRR